MKILNRFTGKVLLEVDSLQRTNLQRADLRGADLRGADLRGADLRGANLQRANLQRANLRGADLRGADLRGANLQRANLQRADLRGANLQRADLWGANLRGANLGDADLRGANLQRADLWGANLRGANLGDAKYNKASLWYKQSRILPDEGSIIGWKKCRNNILVKLLIPDTAKRGHAFGRKCRADKATALEIIGGHKEAISQHDPNFKYIKGKVITPTEDFNEDFDNECASGIHFFITRVEAENY